MLTYFTIYKVSNLLNGKFYIGQHQTTDLQDTYLGSGTSVVRAIKKYGRLNFSKEVLFVFDNFDEMNNKEIEMVTEGLIKHPLCYNQVIGGQGDNSKSLKEYVRTPAHCAALSKAKLGRTQDPLVVERRAKTCKANRAKMSQEERNARFGQCGEANGFYNKQHTADSKQKIRDTIGDSRKGKYNANARSITIDNIAYQTHKECMQQLGLSKRKLKKLKKSLGI